MRDVLGAIVEHVETLGYPPTLRELAVRFGVAHSTIKRDLDGLVAEGKIERLGARAIRITDKGETK